MALHHRYAIMLQVNGQDDVRLILSEHIEKTVQQQYNQGQCQLKAEGEEWQYLLLSIADLLAHQLQEVCMKEVCMAIDIALLICCCECPSWL